jgi:hypothetical protein
LCLDVKRDDVLNNTHKARVCPPEFTECPCRVAA